MSDRDEQLELLTAYLDGEVTDAERAEVESLLASDPAARRLFNELKQTSELVAGLPKSAVPGNFSDGVVARLEREALLGADRVQARGWTFGNWSALAASILLVVAAGWWILPQVERMRPANVAREMAATDAEVESSRTGERVAMNAETRADDEHAIPPAPSTAGMRASRGGPLPGSMTAAGGAPSEPNAAMRPEAAMRLEDESDASSARALGNCVAVSDAAEVDRYLNSGRLTPIKLVSADADEFTNQILVEVPDDKAVPVVGRVVEANFTLNDVPNIENEPKDKPLVRTQRFFARQEIAVDQRMPERTTNLAKSSGETASDSADDDSVRQYVLNAPRSEVAEIVAAVQTACAANGYDTNYDVNGLQFDNNADATVVTGNLLAVVDDRPGDFNDWLTATSGDDGVTTMGDSAAYDEGAVRRSPGLGELDRRDAEKGGISGAADTNRVADKSDEDRTAFEPNKPVEAAVDESKKADAYRKDRIAGREESTSRPSAHKPESIDQPRSRGAPSAGDRRDVAAKRETSSVIGSQFDSNFCGPLQFEPPEESEIVTCVVTIRPAGSNLGNARRGSTASSPSDTRDDSTSPTSSPTTTRPARGDSRG
ncbi:MAG: hypothetical protein H6819_07645 [Phycisphaerales bacterium]|nr:hypothetical protein [Phycisphaerales bacterium]MCB9857632.1 hypothetical protein [Phycisphaerales bacterium]MCB9864811.1 hypothetical protein [Phycisphaerales bacterium]